MIIELNNTVQNFIYYINKLYTFRRVASHTDRIKKINFTGKMSVDRTSVPFDLGVRCYIITIVDCI